MSGSVPPSPFSELQRLLDEMWSTDQRLRRHAVPPPPAPEQNTLALDIEERDGEYLVTASVPGFAPDEIVVRAGDGVLTIAAQHTESREERGTHYLRRERYSGALIRRIPLTGVRRDSTVHTELEHGVLRLVIPRSP